MVACTKCAAQLGPDFYNHNDLMQCLACGSLTRVDAFPALFRETPAGTPGEKILIDDEANCFYHPQKKAVIPCAMCGRFLCALCDVEMNDQHICLSCLESGKKKKKIKNLEHHRTLYDSIALAISILPVLIWFMTCITAPIAVYMVIRYWKAPLSIVHRTKIRFIFALLIAGFQIAGWSALIFNLAVR